MNCPIENQEGAEVLLAYGTRKLDAGSSAILEEHIKVCPACREFADGQQAVWKVLDAWEAAPVSPDFDRRLYARIENEVSLWELFLRPFRPLLFRQGLPIAAAVGVVIMAGVLLDRPYGMDPASPPQTSAYVEAVGPDQAEHTLQEMETMREINRLVHPDNPDSKI